jgi:hypothetical protein
MRKVRKKAHRQIRKNTKGVAGFFEDIPSLIVVVIGVAVFLVTILASYSAYMANQKIRTLEQDCRELVDALRVYDKLAYVGPEGMQEGVFDKEKVISLSTDTLKSKFDTASLGYGYRVSLVDKSDYQNSEKAYNKLWKTGDVPGSGSTITITSSVIIWVDCSERHPAQLIVTIWSLE